MELLYKILHDVRETKYPRILFSGQIFVPFNNDHKIRLDASPEEAQGFGMITQYTKKDLPNILKVINDAALKYKGVIPDDCWHEPYMSEQELIHELNNGVRMFGYEINNILVGVMGVQELDEVTLIRHAYTLSEYQGIGIGKSLLRYLFQINESSKLLVGTWQDASWAIKFYLKNGFILHNRKETDQLLTKYWQVPLKQMENSVVLEKQNI